MRRSPEQEPVLITSAPESSDDQYDRRRKKYAIMMTLRALAIVGAALTYHVSIILALAFVVAGMVLPWCAVIIANDGPAKKKAAPIEVRHDLRSERALPAGKDERTLDL